MPVEPVQLLDRLSKSTVSKVLSLYLAPGDHCSEVVHARGVISAKVLSRQPDDALVPRKSIVRAGIDP